MRDGREVYYDGELVKDITEHSAFEPIIKVRSRMYDMQNEAEFQDATTFDFNGEPAARSLKPPVSAEDLMAQRRYVETVLTEIGGIVERVGDDTAGELWVDVRRPGRRCGLSTRCLRKTWSGT